MQLLYRAFLDIFVKTQREFPPEFQQGIWWFFSITAMQMSIKLPEVTSCPHWKNVQKTLFYSLCTFQLFHKRKIIVKVSFWMMPFVSVIIVRRLSWQELVLLSIYSAFWVSLVLIWLDGFKKNRIWLRVGLSSSFVYISLCERSWIFHINLASIGILGERPC